jgi:hypothetical protein
MDSLSEDVSSNEVQGCKLSERISDEVVNRSQCCLTSMKMRDRNSEEQRGLSYRKQLETIAEDNEQVRRLAAEVGSDTCREKCGRVHESLWIARLKLGVDRHEIREAASNVIDRRAMRLRQVRSRHDQLKDEPTVALQRVQERLKNVELGSGRRNHRHTNSVSH